MRSGLLNASKNLPTNLQSLLKNMKPRLQNWPHLLKQTQSLQLPKKQNWMHSAPARKPNLLKKLPHVQNVMQQNQRRARNACVIVQLRCKI
jgi:hypothetical protein